MRMSVALPTRTTHTSGEVAPWDVRPEPTRRGETVVRTSSLQPNSIASIYSQIYSIVHSWWAHLNICLAMNIPTIPKSTRMASGTKRESLTHLQPKESTPQQPIMNLGNRCKHQRVITMSIQGLLHETSGNRTIPIDSCLDDLYSIGNIIRVLSATQINLRWKRNVWETYIEVQ